MKQAQKSSEIGATRRRWRGSGRLDPDLLYPIRHRSKEAQRDQLRDSLVWARVGAGPTSVANLLSLVARMARRPSKWPLWETLGFNPK